MMGKWKTIILFLILLLLVSVIASKIIGLYFPEDIASNSIAIVKISGAIYSESSDSLMTEGASATKIITNLEKANSNSNVKAIILEINSPGGTVVASREIANAVKKIKKPTVAWIREVGASGAYWVASSADKIVADDLSITGSIGVTSSYFEFTGLMQKYGVTYEDLSVGDYKEMGSPFQKLEPNEREILMKKIKRIQEVFLQDVKKNRNLNDKQVTELSSGAFYLGEEAKELNLVDYLGGKDTAISVAKQMANITGENIVEYKEKKSILDYFTKASAYYFGKGFASQITSDEVGIKA